jgi:type IV secretory pathway VirB6-like protein
MLPEKPKNPRLKNLTPRKTILGTAKSIKAKLINSLKFFLIISIICPIFTFSDSYAIYEGVRDMKWDNGKKRCVDGGYNSITAKHNQEVLNFDPFSSNKDIEWELSNGVCASYIASVGTLIFTQQNLTSLFLCQPSPTNVVAQTAGASATNKALIGPPLPPFPSPGTLLSAAGMASACALSAGYAASTSSACSSGTAFYCPAVPIANYDAVNCCAGAAAFYAIVASAITALAIIYGVANGAYQKARICGHDWKSWDKVDEDGNISPNGVWTKSSFDGSYKKKVQDHAKSITPNLSDEKYREYIFGGKEYPDRGDGACEMPKWRSSLKKKILGYSDGNNLRYYVTGANEAPVFACYRFLLNRGTAEEKREGQKAFDCCTQRSQETVCIENAANVAGPEGNNYEHVFCKIGSRCNVKGVWFDAYASRLKSNYACAKTYSGCPYNHPLGGGTEVEEYEGNSSERKNYCQYMNHCSILPIKPYVASSSLTGAFFDSSCRDMKGDSQNNYGYSSDLSPVDIRGFSAPMAQCFKETIQNMFFNRAGSTACLEPSEAPDGDGICQSGYRYRKGDNLSSYQRSIGQSGDSFLVSIQKKLQDTIRMALSIAVMFYGMSLLIGMGNITKKQLLPLVVKIAFVMYFATGNEWQDWVVNGVIDGSAELSDIIFRTDSLSGSTTTFSDGTQVINQQNDATIAEDKKDGCQFPRYNYQDTNEETKYNIKSYPPGKSYLRIWDTLDCKISRALGYGIEVSVPNLVMMIIGGFFTGGAGIIFFLATLMFAFFLIALTIRALHIFILSVTAIIILFYLSPIMVTMIMFSKTKGMFDKWWKNILSFALQPVILFAYLSILISIFDLVLMGDITFTGDGKNVPKQIVCSGEAANTSIYCIFNPPISGTDGAVKTYDKLKILGIGLPILTSINQVKISALIKAAILMFVMMSFLDKISDFAKALVGGDATLKSNTMSAGQMMSKAYGGLSDIQKRGMGAIKKHGLGAAKKGASIARDEINTASDRGKSASDIKDSGQTRAGSADSNAGNSSTESSN